MLAVLLLALPHSVRPHMLNYQAMNIDKPSLITPNSLSKGVFEKSRSGRS